MCKERRWLRH